MEGLNIYPMQHQVHPTMLFWHRARSMHVQLGWKHLSSMMSLMRLTRAAAQVPWFLGWSAIARLRLEPGKRPETGNCLTWPSTEAAVYAAAAIVQGARGVPAQQAAAHRQLALQALRDWDPKGPSLNYWAEYNQTIPQASALEESSEGSLPGAGTHEGPLDPAVLFWNLESWVTPIRSDLTLGDGVALALELERVIRQLGDRAPPECPRSSDVVPFVIGKIAASSAAETITSLNLDISDALPVSTPAVHPPVFTVASVQCSSVLFVNVNTPIYIETVPDFPSVNNMSTCIHNMHIL